jgi:hypothetical protein
MRMIFTLLPALASAGCLGFGQVLGQNAEELVSDLEIAAEIDLRDYLNQDKHFKGLDWRFDGHQKLQSLFADFQDPDYEERGPMHGLNQGEDLYNITYSYLVPYNVPNQWYTTTLTNPSAYFDPETGEISALKLQKNDYATNSKALRRV